MRSSNKGQIRIIEALIACMILLVGINSAVYISTNFAVEAGTDLEQIAKNVLNVIGTSESLKKIVLNETVWESELIMLMRTLLPPDTFYNLTLVSGLTEQSIVGSVSNIGNLGSQLVKTTTLHRIVWISLPLARDDSRNLDVIFAIDNSHSMRDKEPGDEYRKFYYVKEAVLAFVNELTTSDRVGIVSFSGNDDAVPDGDAKLELPLTNDTSSIGSAIDEVFKTTWSRTDMGAGFAIANVEFVNNTRNDAVQALVFLSDGVCNEPHFDEPGDIHAGHHFEIPCPVAQEYARNESGKVADNGVIIYTIGLGAETWRFDEELLREMQTSGYYYASSGSVLVSIFESIVQDLLFTFKSEIVTITLTLVRAS